MKKTEGNKRKQEWWPIVLGLLLTLPSCYEPVDGCLDNEALNYDLDADNPCADCCEYPSLVLDVQHRYPTETQQQGIIPGNTVHLDDLGQPFRFKHLRFFISNLHLNKESGQALAVLEELPLVVIEGNRIRLDTVEDNFALVSAARLSDYTIGTIKGGGQFKSVTFDLGLTRPTSQADIDELPPGHPLQEPELYLNDDEGFVFLDIALYRDTIQTNLDSVSIQLDRTTAIPEYDFPIDFQLYPGFNTEVVLRVDYALLLTGVNVKTDSAELIHQKIVNNLAKAFSVIDVTANNR